jgi:pyroglutamyl-peptidase
MHNLARARGNVRGGFIHLPCNPELAKPGQPSLPLHAMRDAVVLAIAVSLTRRERRATGGAEH